MVANLRCRVGWKLRAGRRGGLLDVKGNRAMKQKGKRAMKQSARGWNHENFSRVADSERLAQSDLMAGRLVG